MSLAGSSDQPTPKGTEQGKVHAQSSSHDEVSTDDGYAPLISNVGIRCKNRTEPCPCGCSTVEGGGGGMAPTTTTNTGLSVSAISATPWTANAGENDQGGKCTATVLRKVKGASGSSVGRAQDGNQGSQPNAGPPRRSGRVGDNAYRLQAEGPKPQIMSDLRDLDVATVNNRRRATCRYKCSHDDNVRRASASSLMPTALVDDMDERAKARVDTRRIKPRQKLLRMKRARFPVL
ncbi:hypothetical protein UVI_02023810 [Ustilaginoidea virens]|uniref:Uncharacterized protein n=1 Tax=Ustilaginoidea virens TaxID=1159556 RepID=A0A1B5L252_USTVR|nr:hypothetical protein UVI_02023810 [Ustilaginoidea virens]